MKSMNVGLSAAVAVVFAASSPAAAEQALQRTNPPGVSTPRTYSHAVRMGKLVFVAGQVGFDAQGKLVGPGMAEQYEQLLKNMKTVLSSQGADFNHLAKITVFVTSIDEYRAASMADIRTRYFGDSKPASTLVQVVRLAEPEIKIEIEAVAALP